MPSAASKRSLPFAVAPASTPTRSDEFRGIFARQALRIDALERQLKEARAAIIPALSRPKPPPAGDPDARAECDRLRAEVDRLSHQVAARTSDEVAALRELVAELRDGLAEAREEVEAMASVKVEALKEAEASRAGRGRPSQAAMAARDRAEIRADRERRKSTARDAAAARARRAAGESPPPSPLARQYIGVIPSDPPGKWRPWVQEGKRTRYLGAFDSAEEAARARDAEMVRLHGPGCRNLNFPPIAAAPKAAAMGGIIKASVARAETAKGSGAGTFPRSKPNTTGYRGVVRHPSGFAAKVSIGGGKQVYAGFSKTAEHAARLHDAKAIAILGDKAKLNFPAPVAVGASGGREAKGGAQAAV